MLRYLRLIFVAVTGLVLLTLALANRGTVTLRLVPEGIGNMLGIGPGWSLPLFVVILGAIALGILVGFVWEWLREMRLRQTAKTQTKAVARLERELAVLKDSNSVPPKDEVLAILAADDAK
ncbi:LapA family protein [Xinfangfangia sp. D13-10-4-6]|uniref:lipopolysaccharide assembly protein LapA domain-containing protein n=1 Tax=Pseudogemmobacter hezensis TaxID=2737662 RepID=UPI001555D9A1|nr:LapA family protein [Pseudogemmobacter hezensis]NPD15462.1 LapA family protein [Pseudogemmobacter hezensis]